MADLAAALGVDSLKFSSLMRATFTERVAGRMGDARATFSALATQLGCDPSPADLDRVMAIRHEQTRQTVAPRAGALDASMMLDILAGFYVRSRRETGCGSRWHI